MNNRVLISTLSNATPTGTPIPLLTLRLRSGQASPLLAALSRERSGNGEESREARNDYPPLQGGGPQLNFPPLQGEGQGGGGVRRLICLSGTISFLLLLLFFFARPAIAAEGATEIAGLSTEEALRLGEAMYLKGTLPSGKPMEAIVRRDIVLKGNMVTCGNCHMRSGLGSFEGNIITLPTNGAKLFSPLRTGYDLPGTGMGLRTLKNPRPAYTDETLARALRFGVDAGGRMMSETMPRYTLDDRDMEIMIFYLKNLSSKQSPGVTERVMRLATVVANGVKSEDRKALFDFLMDFVGKYPLKLSLDVWELQGPADTWREQLEAFYRQQPVFALVGGLVTGSWRPVHEFCEKNKIPCVFPITDLPVISGSDRYTLYFSKGYYQEGETAAKYLARVSDLPQDKQIIQVFRDNDEGKALARGFEDSWKKLGKATLKNRIVSGDETIGRDFWKELSAIHRNAVMLLWLGPKDLTGIESFGELQERPSMVFVSSTMLDEGLFSLPDKIRDFTFITYPYQLPDERKYILSVVDQWMRARRIPFTNKTISAKVFSLTRILSQVLGGMRRNLYRDYFLDLFDMREDQTGAAVMYPRLSFGPGQRYASKGCYIVTLTKGQEPKLIKKSDWVIY